MLKTFYVIMTSINVFSVHYETVKTVAGRHRLANEWETLDTTYYKVIYNALCIHYDALRIHL